MVDCTKLHPGQSICLGIVGEDCKTTYVVRDGDTCDGIQAKTGINATLLYTNNPQINKSCTNIYIGEVVILLPTSKFISYLRLLGPLRRERCRCPCSTIRWSLLSSGSPFNRCSRQPRCNVPPSSSLVAPLVYASPPFTYFDSCSGRPRAHAFSRRRRSSLLR